MDLGLKGRAALITGAGSAEVAQQSQLTITASVGALDAVGSMTSCGHEPPCAVLPVTEIVHVPYGTATTSRAPLRNASRVNSSAWRGRSVNR